MLGGVDNAKLPQYLSCLDVLVLPSITAPKWKEQFGRILVEANGVRRSGSGSSSGEIPNVIGDAGIVFPEGDSEALSAQILRLASDTRLRAELSEKGIKRARERFDRKVVNRRTYEIFRELIGESSR